MRTPLPVVLVAAMLAIAMALELVLDARVELLPKLPLVALLAIAFARGGPGRGRPR